MIDLVIGEQFSVEFFYIDKGCECMFLLYFKNLESIGIKLVLCLIDFFQYINCICSWDFEVVVLVIG